MNRVRQWLTPPVFEDEDKTRVAYTLHVILLALLGTCTLAFIFMVSAASPGFDMIVTGVFSLMLLGLRSLMRRGHIRLTGALISFALWGTVTLIVLLGGGLSSVIFGTYTVVVLCAGLVLPWRAVMGFLSLTVMAALGMLYAETHGVMPPSIWAPNPLSDWVFHTLILGLATALLYLATSSLNNALARARSKERDLAESNRALQAIRETLEKRVTERTRELEATTADLATRGQELGAANVELEEAHSRQEAINRELQQANERTRRRVAQLQAVADVSRAAAQVRDPAELLRRVTHLISQHFGFYHVGVFLLDETGRYAVLRATNSEGGGRMLARGHRLTVGGQGIVGYVTGTGNPRIALDVGADAVHLASADLPETRSEMALPLRRGADIVGALDVQSTEPAAFDNQDVAVLQTLADQVSVVLENARLFAQAQAALAEAEATHRQYLLQEWVRYEQQAPVLSHEHLLSGWESLAGQPLPAGDAALERGETVALVGDGDAAGATLAVPIKLRDQVIGVLDLQETDKTRQWSKEEIALAQAVAERMAQAIESARLLEQTRTRARLEQLTRQITAHVTAARSVQDILQTGCEELAKALGVTRSMARLHSQEPSGESV